VHEDIFNSMPNSNWTSASIFRRQWPALTWANFPVRIFFFVCDLTNHNPHKRANGLSRVLLAMTIWDHWSLVVFSPTPGETIRFRRDRRCVSVPMTMVPFPQSPANFEVMAVWLKMVNKTVITFWHLCAFLGPPRPLKSTPATPRWP